VLVFGTGELDRLSKACAVASFNTALEWGESVETLVYCSDEVRFPSSCFLHHALHRGEEVYQMGEEMLRRQEAESALALAREYLKSARNASANGFRRLAIDAAYDASELCVKGLLLPKWEGQVEPTAVFYDSSGLCWNQSPSHLSLGQERWPS